MSYISVLPKELRNELTLYINFPYFKALNHLLKDYYVKISSPSFRVVSSCLLKLHYGSFLSELKIKYLEVMTDNLLYYQIPDTEIVSSDLLFKFVNIIPRNPYDCTVIDYAFGRINQLFKDLSCKERMVRYVNNTNMNDYVLVSIND